MKINNEIPQRKLAFDEGIDKQFRHEMLTFNGVAKNGGESDGQREVEGPPAAEDPVVVDAFGHGLAIQCDGLHRHPAQNTY